MEEITVIQTPELTIKAKIVRYAVETELKTMRFDFKKTTITPFSNIVEGDYLEVSNQTLFPVWVDENTPKMENGEQVMIGEWDMWQTLKPASLWADLEAQIQKSLERNFGLVEEEFKYIEPQS